MEKPNIGEIIWDQGGDRIALIGVGGNVLAMVEYTPKSEYVLDRKYECDYCENKIDILRESFWTNTQASPGDIIVHEYQFHSKCVDEGGDSE